jgi:hypothetical protein
MFTEFFVFAVHLFFHVICICESATSMAISGNLKAYTNLSTQADFYPQTVHLVLAQTFACSCLLVLKDVFCRRPGIFA